MKALTEEQLYEIFVTNKDFVDFKDDVNEQFENTYKRFNELELNIGTEFTKTRVDFSAAISTFKTEVTKKLDTKPDKTYLDASLKLLRNELKEDFNSLKKEFDSMGGEFRTLKGEFGNLKGDFSAFKDELLTEIRNISKKN